MADIDGDGRTEVVMSYSDHQITFGLHAGAEGVSTMATNVPWDLDVRRMLDFNGDGLVDFLEVTTGPPSYRLWTNLGTGFAPRRLYDATLDDEIITALSIGVITDLNGDGMDDIFVNWCGTGNSGRLTAGFLSDGMGDFVKVDLSSVGNNARVLGTCDPTFMDVDGDGVKDVVQNESSGGPAGFNIYFRQTAHVDKLTNIKSGLGAKIGVEYSRYDGAVETGLLGESGRGRRGYQNALSRPMTHKDWQLERPVLSTRRWRTPSSVGTDGRRGQRSGSARLLSCPPVCVSSSSAGKCGLRAADMRSAM